MIGKIYFKYWLHTYTAAPRHTCRLLQYLANNDNPAKNSLHNQMVERDGKMVQREGGNQEGTNSEKGIYAQQNTDHMQTAITPFILSNNTWNTGTHALCWPQR